jgi:hypothetical protein
MTRPIRALTPMRITRIKAAPLFGETPKGGWSTEIKPEDSAARLPMAVWCRRPSAC